MEKVDKFLYVILENRNCSDGGAATAAEFLQKSEGTIISFLHNDERSELEFPPLNSFYRRIIHCLGRRYHLVHRVEATNIFNSNSTLRKIYLAKPVGGEQQKFQGPILKSSDWIVEIERETGIIETAGSIKKTKKIRTKKSAEKPTTPKIKILKRETATVETASAAASQISSVTTSPLLALDALTLEEREAKYQAARDRIFEGFTTETESFEGVVDRSAENVNVDTVSVDIVSDDAKIESVPVTSANIIPVTPVTLATPSIALENNNNTQRSTALNPDAVPFSFTPAEPAPEPAIEINHIYTVTAAAGQLTSDHLKELLAAYPTVTIKTHTTPADMAFLLFHKDGEISSSNEKWTISKWIPEFYLD